jgi:hypothetical protein
MALKLYIDHNVPGEITKGLRQRDVDLLTCAQDGTDRLDDDLVLQRATELRRVVFTQDTDFLAITTQWLRSNREFAGVIFAAQLGITIGDVIRDLELLAGAMDEAEMRNRVFTSQFEIAQSSGFSPAGAIFTIFGSNRASTSTRSACASITV